MNEKISVIIPTKNRTQDVIRCLNSIKIQTMLPDEVVIVDSSDTEELKSTLNSFDDLNIRYIHIEVDKKFKGSSNISRNRGIDNSIGDIIILVDDDVILDGEYIKNIIHIFNNDSEKKNGGVIGEIIENTEQDKKAVGFIKRFLRFGDQALTTIFFLLILHTVKNCAFYQ